MSHADDYAEFWRETSPRARKPHACTACHVAIMPGWRYRRITSFDAGNVFEYKLCSRCMQLYDAIREMDPQEPITPLLDCGMSWKDAFGEPPSPGLEALAFWDPAEWPNERRPDGRDCTDALNED